MEEIIGKRTRRSKTFDLGGGKFRLETGRYRHTQKNGLWLPIDNTIESKNGVDSDTGLQFVARSRQEMHDYSVRFGKNNPAWMKIKHLDSGKKIVFKPKNCNNNPDHQVVGNKITVSQVWPGIDMELFVVDNGTKTNYVITSAAGQRVVEFNVSGDIADFAVGKPFYRVAPGTPFVFINTAFSSGVLSYDFTNVPVGTVVDPSVSIQEAYPSSYGNALDPGHSTTVRGGTGFPYMELGSNQAVWAVAVGPECRNYLFIRIEDVPAGSIISNAVVTLTTDYTSATNEGYLRRALRNWSPTEVCWNYASLSEDWGQDGGGADSDRNPTASGFCPNVSGVGQFNFSGEGLNTDISDWINGVAPNYGWHLQGSNGGGGQQEFLGPGFATAASRPQLTFDYEEVGGVVKPSFKFGGSNYPFARKGWR